MPRFLIVDDDPACRRLLEHYLKPFGHCDLTNDGHEAIAAFRLALDGGEPYDLVCLDIMMPEADGHAALQAIRDLEERRGIDGTKVLMTTAVCDSKHCLAAFREGCEAYLTKPFDKPRLLNMVRFLVGDCAAIPEADLCPV